MTARSANTALAPAPEASEKQALCSDGHVVADVIRLDKGHTEGLKPNVTEEVVELMLSAALSLAALGVCGLFALVVAERTQEVGIRMALGATPGDIGRMVFKYAAGVLLGGTLAGIALSAAASQALSAGLFGVRPFDPGPTITAIAILTVVAVAAAAVPARRAVRTDPVSAIRVD